VKLVPARPWPWVRRRVGGGAHRRWAPRRWGLHRCVPIHPLHPYMAPVEHIGHHSAYRSGRGGSAAFRRRSGVPCAEETKRVSQIASPQHREDKTRRRMERGAPVWPGHGGGAQGDDGEPPRRNSSELAIPAKTGDVSQFRWSARSLRCCGKDEFGEGSVEMMNLLVGGSSAYGGAVIVAEEEGGARVIPVLDRGAS
jgi:hypothetical protein